jgi:hypothetical protein
VLVIVKEGVNKSSHPIQNPLLLVNKPLIRDILVSELAEFDRLDRIIGTKINLTVTYYKNGKHEISESHEKNDGRQPSQDGRKSKGNET